jgi:hypothetical protein
MDKYRALLESDNQTLRLAALDALRAEDDLALRQFAYRTAFASDDQTLCAVALKRRIGDMKTLDSTVEPPWSCQATAPRHRGGESRCWPPEDGRRDPAEPSALLIW